MSSLGRQSAVATFVMACMTTLTVACTGPPSTPTSVSETFESPTSGATDHLTSASAEPPTAEPAPSPAPPDDIHTRAPASACETQTLIESVDWIQRDGAASLEVRPTATLRECGRFGASQEAWLEVLAIVPAAGTAGMREQFTCHVLFAPTKDVWHLEPWRPVVDGTQLVAAQCNPGGADPDLG